MFDKIKNFFKGAGQPSGSQANQSSGRRKNTPGEDIAVAFGSIVLPMAAKFLVNSVSKKDYAKVFANKEVAWQKLLSFFPLLVHRVTNLGVVADYYVTDFFQEVKSEISKRSENEQAGGANKFNKHKAWSKLVNILHAKSGQESDDLIKTFTDMMEGLSDFQHDEMFNFIATMRLQDLEKLLSLDPQTRRFFIEYLKEQLGGVEPKSYSEKWESFWKETSKLTKKFDEKISSRKSFVSFVEHLEEVAKKTEEKISPKKSFVSFVEQLEGIAKKTQKQT